MGWQGGHSCHGEESYAQVDEMLFSVSAFRAVCSKASTAHSCSAKGGAYSAAREQGPYSGPDACGIYSLR
jgi:hypothetical protein